MATRKKSKSTTDEPGVETIATNRRAAFDFELGERYEAGIVLIGSEVKSLRARAAGIAEAWAIVLRGEVFLEGMRIAICEHAAYGHTNERRSRKLLLHKREIQALQRAIDRDGMTVVATRLYFRAGRAKVELAVAKGRRKADKREAIKTRDAEREARVAIARRRVG